MFYSQQINKGNGIYQTNFYLTQGDVATIKSTPTIIGGTYQPSDVTAVKFRLCKPDYTFEDEQSFTQNSNTWVLNLTSTTTANYDVGEHLYEIEYTLTGGNHFTTNQGEFVVYKQLPSAPTV